MNCWKSYNIKKEIGLHRLYLISTLIGVLAFIILYVPYSIVHNSIEVNEYGIIPLLIAVILLPAMHSFMHIISLKIMNKSALIVIKRTYKWFPVFTYYTKSHVTKKVSLLTACAPTIFITIPGLAASFLFADFYVYILLFTSLHIGITFIDFWYINHILRAPKQSFIQKDKDGFDILLKLNEEAGQLN
ncbi:DUF3267 domain-containing protein [Oceanobacillus piezotolerans]|uniref:DUF3267 domain-containing protein n=1 Tax=Oceanobacillus piezotolerans TaxID=2448030 RepID=A0A498D834_9BACI|nr:DUF3267 domain-containing protein [Oceanobacillus piezotolerans]RLL45007.1 DUF3267 domain-containing protein [Oceanobacillus piezotolerans]